MNAITLAFHGFHGGGGGAGVLFFFLLFGVLILCLALASRSKESK